MGNFQARGDFRLGPLCVCMTELTIRNRNEVSRVSPRAMKVLVYLYQHRNQVISSCELLDKFWSPLASQHTIYKAIAELRSAMGDNARQQRFIKTYSKHGYKLEIPDVKQQESIYVRLNSFGNNLRRLSLRALSAINRSALRNQ